MLRQNNLNTCVHCANLWGFQIVPLVKSASKGAFRKNIKAEIKAGKPARQAVAIAYSVQRKSKKNG